MNIDQLQPLFDWIHTHPNLAGLIVFFISMIESIVIIGLIIPGSVMMTAIGTLAGSGILPIHYTIFWAILGAIAGDNVSYWLGYHYHEQIRQMWPMKQFPQLLLKGEKFFQNHGGKSVFLGRFVGPVRPIVPVVAGMMNMPPKRFMIANVLSAIGWAPAYMLPGILLGAASTQLAPAMATRFLVIVILILLLLWAISIVFKRAIAWCLLNIDQLLQKAWHKIAQQPSWRVLHCLLHVAPHNRDHRQFSLMVYFCVALLAFLLLTFSVITHGFLTAANIPLFHLLRSLYTPLIQQAMIAITFLGQGSVLFVLVITVAIWLSLKQQMRVLWFWLALALLSMFCMESVKHLLHIARPSAVLHTPTGWSFPSGHTTLSIAFYGFIAYLIAQAVARPYRWLVYGCAGTLISLIAFSRLYLSAHWLSDILGGLLLGIICLLFILLWLRRKPSTLPPWPGLLAVAVLGLGIGWSCQMLMHYKSAINAYTPYLPSKTLDANAWWIHNTIDEPLYRKTRTGKAVQILNVQWAGDLTTIRDELEEAGWVLMPKRSLFESLANLIGAKQQHYPILSQLYKDQKPILIMSKALSQKQALLILRLWDIQTTLNGSNTPLWMGSLAYHRPFEFKFLAKKTTNPSPDPSQLPPAIQILEGDLRGFEWKQMNYSQLLAPQTRDNADWNGTILLVRPLANWQ